jgi:hypothetical protein
LCDTALGYAYAGQRERIDAQLIHDFEEDKQPSGSCPGRDNTMNCIANITSVESSNEQTAVPATRSAASTAQSEATGKSKSLATTEQTLTADKPAKPVTPAATATKKPDAAESELLRICLSRLLTKFGIQVIAIAPLQGSELHTLNQKDLDILQVERDDHRDNLEIGVCELFEKWGNQLLVNDSLVAEACLSLPNRLDYDRKLSQKLYSLVPQASQSVA